MVGPVAVKCDEIMKQVERKAAKSKARDRSRITPNGLTLLKMSLVADAGDSSDLAILESSSGDACKTTCATALWLFCSCVCIDIWRLQNH